ncbi:hypothetical protein [Paraburkholderia tropica]|uniref:hypothetical protein n=1 Tax=Paraburkholderia tropica TaxID=92647 RepID=UPI002AB67392|nr:hypothetical protein [Paraburkholderia tropica]
MRTEQVGDLNGAAVKVVTLEFARALRQKIGRAQTHGAFFPSYAHRVSVIPRKGHLPVQLPFESFICAPIHRHRDLVSRFDDERHEPRTCLVNFPAWIGRSDIDGGDYLSVPEQCCSFGNAGSLSLGSVAPLGMPGVVRQVPGWLTDGQASYT